jgi:serine/threonine-protein kinase
MAIEAPEPNRVLAGRYRLESRLGVGGMGAIWRAEHLVLRAPVAVKLIDREAVPDDDTVARFMREAQSAATLRSPHVVQILDYGVDQAVPFIVMELLEGENLAQRLKRVKRLSPGETAKVLTQVGRAVQRAHEAGIVHRDLKPENVFLVHNEDDEVAKVLDFGVAKVEQAGLGPEGTRTRTGSILGTPYYMSPEQAQGNKTVDFRSDLWSLGVIAFECLLGKRPFWSDGLGDLVLMICVRDMPIPSEFGAVPLGFDEWFARACSRDPEARFQSARELTEALREALGLEGRDPNSEVEVVVSAGEGYEGPPPPVSELPTVAVDAHVAQTMTRPAFDPNARTLTASSPDNAEAQVQAPTEAMFGTTQHPVVPEPKSRGGAVLLVAGSALALGLFAGFFLLNERPQRPLPAPLEDGPAQAGPAPEKPSLSRPKKDSEARATPSAVAEELAEPSAVEGDETESETPPDAAVDASVRLSEAKDAGAAAAPSATAPASDAGWQKPEWAQPDNEIPIRRGPGEADDKIILNP